MTKKNIVFVMGVVVCLSAVAFFTAPRTAHALNNCAATNGYGMADPNPGQSIVIPFDGKVTVKLLCNFPEVSYYLANDWGYVKNGQDIKLGNQLATSRGATWDLGNWTAGQPLVMYFSNWVRGTRWVTGPASANPNGRVQADIIETHPSAGVTKFQVGFEEATARNTYWGYPEDFNDVILEVTVTAPSSGGSQCIINAQCPTGQFCSNGQCTSNTNQCNPACGTNQTCTNGQCVNNNNNNNNNQCTTTAQCGANQTCVSGTCTNNIVSPSVQTLSPSNVGQTSVLLNGNLTGLGNDTSAQVFFRWGTTVSYGSDDTNHQTMTSTGSFNQAVSGLTPGVLYHFTACAQNSVKTVCGSDVAFFTDNTSTSGTCTTSASCGAGQTCIGGVCQNNLSVTCNAIPNPAFVGNPVTFMANPVGGIGTYSYSWTGDCIGFASTCSTTYGSAGTRTAFLTITSGTQTATTSCSLPISTSTNNNGGGGNNNAVCNTNADCGTNGYFNSNYCSGNNVYRDFRTWTCNNAGTANAYCSSAITSNLQTSCSSNQTCNTGSCNTNVTSCTSHATSRCDSGGVYWFDSCGNRQELYQACTGNQYCSGNTCVNNNNNQCTSHSQMRCNGSQVQWYDSCGNAQEVVQTCSNTQYCSGNTCINNYNNNTGNQYGNLQVNVQVRNVSAGGFGWSNSINASPSDILQFQITVQNTGNQTANNVVVTDNLPPNIYFQNTLTTDGSANSGNITAGLNIGSIAPGQTRTITFQAQVAPSQNFNFGSTTLTNTTNVSSDQGSNSSSSSITVTKTGVYGATTVSTGLTNYLFKDSFFTPLLALLFIAWLFRSRIFNVLDMAFGFNRRYLTVEGQLSRKIEAAKRKDVA